MPTYRATLAELYTMLLQIRLAAHTCGFKAEDSANIELAAEEAIVNIIHYAYLPTASEEGSIELEWQVLTQPPGLSLTLSDCGYPYNPLAHHTATPLITPPAEHKIGGYGIYYIVQLMDDVRYRHDGTYNRLTLIKYLPNA